MKLVVFIANLLLLQVKCANILGVFPAPGYSQYILAEFLMKEIASRGHQVTVISPHTPKNAPPNYKIINTSDVIEDSNGNYVINCEKYLFSDILFKNVRNLVLIGRLNKNSVKNVLSQIPFISHVLYSHVQINLRQFYFSRVMWAEH
jgi:hypothetical protein